MKALLRNYLISLGALVLTSQLLPGLVFEGGTWTILLAAGVCMLINFLVVPILKLMFLPLNLLTLGFFAWVVNVVALYFLTLIMPKVKILPYVFPGLNLKGLVIPSLEMNVLMVAVAASFLIGMATNLLRWLTSPK